MSISSDKKLAVRNWTSSTVLSKYELTILHELNNKLFNGERYLSVQNNIFMKAANDEFEDNSYHTNWGLLCWCLQLCILLISCYSSCSWAGSVGVNCACYHIVHAPLSWTICVALYNRFPPIFNVFLSTPFLHVRSIIFLHSVHLPS